MAGNTRVPFSVVPAPTNDVVASTCDRVTTRVPLLNQGPRLFRSGQCISFSMLVSGDSDRTQALSETRYTRTPKVPRNTRFLSTSNHRTCVFRTTRPAQPPLQYYLHVLEEKDWDSVTFLTAAWMQKAINPTFAILEIMAKAGTLGENVRMLKVRRDKSTWKHAHKNKGG